MKKIISFIVLILWMIVIFSFSSADANKSTGTSDKVITTMIEIKDKITNNETPNNEKEIIVKNSSFYIRKIAHITEYLILGFLTFNLLKQYSVTNIYYAIGLSILYSCTDEFHQLFISGRSGSIRDVLIDSIGILIGTYLYKLLFIKNKEN
ncbi:MAG: VanZ family protein [Tenericutes bacterium]|nr:VanZ family protein [Mycoplasmatota bacterium]